MPKQLIFVGVLKAWMTSNALDTLEKKRLTLAMQEVAQSGGATSNKTGGKLKLGGLVFQEYKVNTKADVPLRFFGFFNNEDLHVTAVANYHKNHEYQGMTWDGVSSWREDYVAKTTDVDSFLEAAFDDELLHRSGKGVPHVS